MQHFTGGLGRGPGQKRHVQSPVWSVRVRGVKVLFGDCPPCTVVSCTAHPAAPSYGASRRPVRSKKTLTPVVRRVRVPARLSQTGNDRQLEGGVGVVLPRQRDHGWEIAKANKSLARERRPEVQCGASLSSTQQSPTPSHGSAWDSGPASPDRSRPRRLPRRRAVRIPTVSPATVERGRVDQQPQDLCRVVVRERCRARSVLHGPPRRMRLRCDAL